MSAPLRLMGVTEAAQRLCVTRQRVTALYKEHPRFPQPVAVLSCGAIWRAADIEWFAGLRRPPGRPRKETKEV